MARAYSLSALPSAMSRMCFSLLNERPTVSNVRSRVGALVAASRCPPIDVGQPVRRPLGWATARGLILRALGYCTSLARRRVYSSSEIDLLAFSRSSFSISSAALKPTAWRK